MRRSEQGECGEASPEFSLLLTALRFYLEPKRRLTTPELNSVSPEKFLKLCEFHFLLPQAAYLLRYLEPNHSLSIRVERHFTRSARIQKARQTLFAQIEKQFLLRDIPFVSPNRLHFSGEVYSSPHDRQIRNIKLTIPTNFIEAAHDSLLGIGFETEALDPSLRPVLARGGNAFVYVNKKNQEVIILPLGIGNSWHGNVLSFGCLMKGVEIDSPEFQLRLLSHACDENDFERLCVLMDFATCFRHAARSVAIDQCFLPPFRQALLLSLLQHYELLPPEQSLPRRLSLCKEEQLLFSKIRQLHRDPPCMQSNFEQIAQASTEIEAPTQIPRATRRERKSTNSSLRRFYHQLRERVSLMLF